MVSPSPQVGAPAQVLPVLNCKPVTTQKSLKCGHTYMATANAGDVADVSDTQTPVADAEPTAEVESAPTKQTTDTSKKAPEKAEITPEETVEGEGEEEKVPYSRFKEVNDRLKEAERKSQLLDALKTNPQIAEQFLRESGSAVQADPQLVEADKQLKNMGYAKMQDMQTYVRDEIVKHDAEKEFISSMKTLEGKYDGADGSPKFVPENVARYMDDKGINDPEVAYEVMNKDALADVRAKAKKKAVYSERPGQPMSSGDDDYEAKLEEAKRTKDWSKIITPRLKIPSRS